MSKKQIAKLKQYIKDERPQRMKLYVRKHHLDLLTIKLKHGRNLLHYCCQHGTGAILRYPQYNDYQYLTGDKFNNARARGHSFWYLRKEKVRGNDVDDALETPLHLSLERAIRYEESERPDEATQCYTGLVLPLLEEYPESVDMEDIDGTTCRHLLNKLVMLRQHSQPKNGDSREARYAEGEDEEDKEDEVIHERLWRDKLADECHFEYNETWGHDVEGFVSYEENAETYDDWTERIRQQYYDKKRAQREAEYTASSRKKRKTAADTEQTDRETDHLNEARRKLKEKYEHYQRQDRDLKLLKRKVKYENEYKTLFERKDKGDLGYSDIPWPGGDKSEDDIMILVQGLQKDSSDYKKYLREQKIRWHPDKFLQRFGAHLVAADKERIMNRVTELSQKLNKLSEL